MFIHLKPFKKGKKFNISKQKLDLVSKALMLFH